MSFKKKQEKSRRKMLREEYEEQHPRIITEDELLENHSYYDIDMLSKANSKTNKAIAYWKERYDNASSNMGKWYCQIRIDLLRKKLKHYQ
jgi:tRNA nucleotidyltransferase/poly(A) polymerase